jgi:uncharacterized protein YdaU (DUF1376 family)
MGDYATATRHLSWDEDAAYRRLLDAYYTREAPLPADMRQVFRLVVAASQEQREAVETVLNEFFELTDEGWVNRRADREIDAMREKQQKQRDKANAMWEKRRAGTRQSHSTEHGTASAIPMHTNEHAAASKTDADAMPPTPTPTPTPKKEEGEARKRAPAPKQPDGVSDQVWTDWLQLRRAKRAPVTQTVVDGAIREAGKAGLTVEAFLAVWCRRGSQGLEAAWLRPEERGQAVESFRERDARQAAEKVKAWTGGLCHDRKALGEERKPLPFERGYVKPADTVEGEAHEQRRIAC